MSSRLLLLLHSSIFLGWIEGGMVLKSNGEINRLGREFQSGQAPTWEDLEILLDWTRSFALFMQAVYLDLHSLKIVCLLFLFKNLMDLEMYKF